MKQPSVTPKLQNPNAERNACDSPNRVPFAIVLRHHYPSISALLKEAENQGEVLVDLDKKSGGLLSPMLSLWQQAGRPEIVWPQIHLPFAMMPGECLLESYLNFLESQE